MIPGEAILTEARELLDRLKGLFMKIPIRSVLKVTRMIAPSIPFNIPPTGNFMQMGSESGEVFD